MNIYDELENLKAQARLNPALAQALLDTRTVSNPVTAFCRIAQENGCTFSAMDLISAGEDSYAAMRRSTMPVRSMIHSWEVSTIFSRSALVRRRSGT